MQIPLEITYRHMEHSDSLDRLLRDKVAKLEQFFDRIVGCRVVIEAPSAQQAGGPFGVSVSLTVPGEQIVVQRGPEPDGGGDVYTAIHGAFATLTRQLKEHVARWKSDARNRPGKE